MVYKYKDKSDAAKVHSAPATGRRVSYSRTDNKTYRNTGGASTRAGAELRAKQTFGVPGTDGAEKKKSRKKRVIKRFAKSLLQSRFARPHAPCTGARIAW